MKQKNGMPLAQAAAEDIIEMIRTNHMKHLYHLAICRAGFVNIVNRRVRQYRRRRARSYAASIRVLQ